LETPFFGLPRIALFGTFFDLLHSTTRPGAMGQLTALLSSRRRRGGTRGRMPAAATG
jgi:hypothetical protein